MTRTEFANWSLELDVESTAQGYRSIGMGGPEICGCVPCLNFAANRESNFPTEISDFLSIAGIPIDREAEVYHNCRLESGLHSYGGWFHFVGKVVNVDEHFEIVSSSSGYQLCDFGGGTLAGISTKLALVNPAFEKASLLQFEFVVEIPWVIEAAEVV